MKLTDIRSNFKAAKGVWVHTKMEFYAKCKTKFDLTDAEIAFIMDIPESSVKELAKGIILDKEEK